MHVLREYEENINVESQTRIIISMKKSIDLKMTHIFKHHKHWALILTTNWSASWGKKDLFSPLTLLLKIRKLTLAKLL